jgi:hypothetical protein
VAGARVEAAPARVLMWHSEHTEVARRGASVQAEEAQRLASQLRHGVSDPLCSAAAGEHAEAAPQLATEQRQRGGQRGG